MEKSCRGPKSTFFLKKTDFSVNNFFSIVSLRELDSAIESYRAIRQYVTIAITQLLTDFFILWSKLLKILHLGKLFFAIVEN